MNKTQDADFFFYELHYKLGMIIPAWRASYNLWLAKRKELHLSSQLPGAAL